ncbi:MAG TPA: hypothetical protein QGF58_30525 [Myxococcota bacterium]|nr:hypothetical protein [Myxococcota bacterium]
MTLLVLLTGCAQHVAWKVAPAPAVEVDVTTLSVAAEGAECRDVADAVLVAMDARPGVAIDPGASTTLVVKDCDEFLSTIVEVEGEWVEIDEVERRRVTVEGTGNATVEVRVASMTIGTLDPQHYHSESSSWANEGRIPAPRARAVSSALDEGLAQQVADDLAPLPAQLSRRVYAQSEPGTARALHNEAVAAEQSGDLDGAMRLAREAYAADPSPRSMRYLEALEAHAATVGYAFNTE